MAKHFLNKRFFRGLLVLLSMIAASSLVLAAPAPASGGVDSLSTVATNITGNFGALAKMITAAAYVAGFGFAFAAILKFKAHKDNPQQIPVGTPIALLFVGAALIFLPTLFSVSGATVFGSGASVGGSSGMDNVPGFSQQSSDK
ncbi:MAG: type IV secretion protein IcmD [Gammaproteobacteria bacterium CG11_big_fil_rev_8_21_14_0_20_46_22]|nr:MAG: type IV secretion protein IcmD [Gammaproteobacteria bacterium CG12_big_fil_rev_8_21_14_0_65_46_12]PIR12150.1 MAG: type IV secretion protein IcmD [Gammaproteobacteria bacterium CG11_big_fil_rev_8_21_14_0_20_46_22]